MPLKRSAFIEKIFNGREPLWEKISEQSLKEVLCFHRRYLQKRLDSTGEDHPSSFSTEYATTNFLFRGNLLQNKTLKLTLKRSAFIEEVFHGRKFLWKKISEQSLKEVLCFARRYLQKRYSTGEDHPLSFSIEYVTKNFFFTEGIF